MAYLFDLFQKLLETHPEKPGLEESLQNETHRIVSEIDRELFSVQCLEQAQFYTQKVELVIARYDTLIKDLLDKDDNISKTQHLEQCRSCLDKVKYHLESTYSPYRSPHSLVSRKTISEITHPLSIRKNQLESLLNQSGISCKLKSIILHPVCKIISCQCPKIPCQKIEYITYFLDELIQIIESLGNIDEQHLLLHLYILNFNTIPLLSYICDQYMTFRAEISDDQLIIDHLNTSKNQINKIPCTRHAPFNTNMRDLKEQVLCWIEEEVVMIKKEMKKAKKKEESLKPKLKFNYSVEVISGLYKLLHDAGITSSGANQTVRWIARNVSSKNQPNISPQSIQRKFYEKNSNKEQLKEIIIHLLNHLNRNK